MNLILYTLVHKRKGGGRVASGREEDFAKQNVGSSNFQF